MRQLYAYVANESTQNDIIYMCMFSTEVPVASQSAMRNSKFVSLECAITFFLTATDPKARATVSIPLLKKFGVNVSILIEVHF